MKTAPDFALTSLNARPVFSNINNGSRCLTRGMRGFDHIVRMPIDWKQIGIAVVVVVEKPGPQPLSNCVDGAISGLIGEDQLALVVKD